MKTLGIHLYCPPLLSVWIAFLSLIQAPQIAAGAELDRQRFTRPLLETMRDRGELNGWTILYYWSPHMPLSRRGLSEIRKWSQENGVRLLELMEPNRNPRWASTPSCKKEQRCLRYSFHLEDSPLRQLRTHAPSLALLKNGVAYSKIVPGYDRISTIRSSLRIISGGEFP